IAFIGALLISLSDFYFPSLGIPVVPMLGTVLFVTISIAWPKQETAEARKRRRTTTLLALVLISLYVASAIWGLVAFHSAALKGAVGMGLGTLILTVVLHQEENVEYRRTLLMFCTRLLAIHLAFWALQFFVSILAQ